MFKRDGAPRAELICDEFGEDFDPVPACPQFVGNEHTCLVCGHKEECHESRNYKGDEARLGYPA